MRPSLTTERLVAVFLLGCLLLNFPLLFLFDHPFTVGGVPLLFVYVFAAWGLVVALLWLVMNRVPPADDEEP